MGQILRRRDCRDPQHDTRQQGGLERRGGDFDHRDGCHGRNHIAAILAGRLDALGFRCVDVFGRLQTAISVVLRRLHQALPLVQPLRQAVSMRETAPLPRTRKLSVDGSQDSRF